MTGPGRRSLRPGLAPTAALALALALAAGACGGDIGQAGSGAEASTDAAATEPAGGGTDDGAEADEHTADEHTADEHAADADAADTDEPSPEPPPAAPSPEPQPAAPIGTAATGEVVCGGDPDDRGFDRFYDRYCDAAGLPVLASGAVEPRAVEATAEIMVAMIGHRPDLIEAIAEGGVRIGVLASTEVVTDLPEYRNLYQDFPGTDWNTRTRGLGATSYIPLSSAAEENVLCWDDDVYRGESILVHEFAHTVHIMGLDVVDPTFSPRLQDAYDRAMAAGLWVDTYAATNAEEYFAEAVQSWFDTNQVGPPGGDGIHNDIDTRVELVAYDPGIAELIAEVFPGGPLPLCRAG